MATMSIKEKIFYRFICNENRVYKYWYTRFQLAGLDLGRIRRVVGRIRKWDDWCSVWFEEGRRLEHMAGEALALGDRMCARRWFHEAAGCFHVGQHFFYLNDDLKQRCLEKIWEVYPKELALYAEDRRPVRVDIPFRGVPIPGYLRLCRIPKKPLVIQINGLDNLKECEQHAIGEMLSRTGFNTLVFDGPGQGEMWADMKMIPDYHSAVSAVLDWIEHHHHRHIDKELKYYPDGEHVCANYLDEVLPYAVDWLSKHLRR